MDYTKQGAMNTGSLVHSLPCKKWDYLALIPLLPYITPAYEFPYIHSFIHSFHWHAQNVTIPCHSLKLLPFLLCTFYCHPSPPTILPYSLTSSCHLFLGLPLNLLLPNSYIIPFWEFYFLPISVHAQTNVIYLTLLSLL